MNVEWLPDFFAGENKIDLAKVMNGDYGPEYRDMMEPLVRATLEQRWPVILPYSDRALSFYAAAQDERMLLELRRVLSASLGSADTHADFPIIKEAGNSSEKVLLDYAPVGLMRVTMLDTVCNDLEAKKRVFGALKRVLCLYEQRPPLTVQVRRPVGRVLREFFTACQVADGTEANKLFLEIKASGSLSQRNLLFLEFQVLAASQQWDDILSHGQLASCLNGRIPLQVARLLLNALANRFQQLLRIGFSGVELEQTRQECQVLAPLFSKPPRLAELRNIEDEWKAWAIGAALYGFPDIDQYVPVDIEPSWLHNLFAWVGIERREHDAAPEKEKHQKEEKLLDLQRAKELLQYALVAPPEEILEIISELSVMPRQVAEQVKEIPILYKHWLALQHHHLPQDYGWTQWFADICEQEQQTDELRQLAMSECMEWPTSSFDPDTIQQALETEGSGKAGEVLRDVMPLMLSWLHDRDISCWDLFWVKLLELLALDDIANQQDVQLSSLVLERLLGKSYSKESYEEALQAIEMLLDKVNSVQSYDAVLELMDLLLDNPCPSSEAQQSLWLTIQKFAFNKWHRLAPLLRQLTLFSAREVLGPGAEDAFAVVLAQSDEEEQLEEQFPDLAGKVLAIYTLTEGAARRAKGMLENLFDGLLIHLNHDHVATSSLVSLAEKAEYFIFAAQSAKHQAFYAVTNIRTDIIYPQGKGASSIVREFVSQICKIGL